MQTRAQDQKSTQKGQWMLGQSFFVKSENKNNSSTETHYLEIRLQTNVSYFVGKRFSAGLLLNYLYRKESRPDNSSLYTWKNLEIGPMFRYYPLAGLFVEASSKWNIDYFNIYTTGNVSNLQHHLGIGYTYRITPSVAIEPKLSYQFYTSEDLYRTKSKTNFLVGFQIIL
jgi:hypothetical protein